MTRARGRSAVFLGCAFALAACGSDVKTYRARAPQTDASARAKPADPAAWRSERPKAGEPAEVRFPAPDVAKLASGLTLYVVERPAEVVTLRFVVRHGASSVKEGKSGLAALTARMLTEGTRKHSSLALAEAAEALGATLESDAGRDESSVGLSALPTDVDRALALLAEVVTEPAFNPKELERVRSEWLDGLVAERQTPDRLASLAGLRLLNGPVHGAPVAGGVSDVKALKAAELVEFHARFWQPDSAALILVGKVTLAGVRAGVERHFRGFRKRATTPIALVALPAAPDRLRIVLVDRPGSVQSAVFAAQRFPPRSVPGYEARELLGEVVGGLFTSRINMNLREKHAYTYGARGRPVATRHWGSFVVSTSVRTDVTAPALAQIMLELKKARDPKLGAPIAPSELERGRADLLHSLGARLEHTSRVTEAVKSAFVNGLGDDYYSRYPGLIATIGTAEVTEGAKLLDVEHLVVVIAGDREQIAGDLARVGGTIETAPPWVVD